jgi:tripartite ATP-independent transporter DctP family solute receptor
LTGDCACGPERAMHAEKRDSTMICATRRKLIGLGVMAAAAIAVPMRSKAAAQFRFKCATDAPETHPFTTYARKAAQKIDKDTDGRLVVEVFANSQLGTSTDMLSQARSGSVEMLGLQSATLSTLVPIASISAVGFAFKDYPAVWAAMDGDVGSLVRDSFASTGLQLPCRAWDSGFRMIFSRKKKIVSPDDLKNFKIRVPVSPLWLSMFRGLGSAPVAINVAELYSALETGIADGCELPISGFESLKAYEVQKYGAITNHIWDGYWPVVNGRVWKSLPAELQEVFVRNFDEAGKEQRAFNEQLSNGFVTSLTHKGMSFNTPDRQPFRTTLSKAGFYAEWQKKFGPNAWDMLERHAGTLS